MIIMEALAWASTQLKPVCEPLHTSPLLEAEILLSEALRTPKAHLIAHMESEVDPSALACFQNWVTRRLQHEPVAYLIGKKEFYGRTFLVNPSVLIPRPATETLIDGALEIARTMSADHDLVADIGTGSGAIAITMALESGMSVIATDISKEALDLAQENARRLGAEASVRFLEGDLLDPLLALWKSSSESLPQHLLLCANLPYLSHAQWETTMSDVRDFEPEHALVCELDGLGAYWKMFLEIKQQRRWFPKRLSIVCEHDPSQTIPLRDIVLHTFPDAQVCVTKDLEGFDRITEVGW